MSPLPDRRRMKGVGRVSFIAHLGEITAELDAGWPIKAIYEKRADALGLSYAQFARYVAEIVRRGRGTRVGSNPGGAPQSSAPAANRPMPEPRKTMASEGHAHVGHQSARTFNHDPLERPDDRKRLLGEE